jgi:hypothetical protein
MKFLAGMKNYGQKFHLEIMYSRNFKKHKNQPPYSRNPRDDGSDVQPPVVRRDPSSDTSVLVLTLGSEAPEIGNASHKISGKKIREVF